ncbi:MAG TPA: CHAT domain-containing protein [Pyrinomonadaceae bacterium]
MNVQRGLLMLLAVLLCLVARARAPETPDAREAARQTAASVNDDAISLEERQEALKRLEEAARLFISAGETIEAARVLNRAGHLQLILNKPQDALDSHRQALALLKQTPSLEAEVDNLNGLASAYMYLKEFDRAEEFARDALSLSKRIGYIPGQAQALLTLSDHQNYDKHTIALEMAQEALGLWQALDDKPGLARTYSQIGRCYLAQNTLPEATRNYEKALQLWRELNNPPEQAEALIMLGFIEQRKAEWQSSISFFIQAQGLLDERAEPAKMGQIAAGLAAVFNDNGLPENALTQYQRALDYFRQTPDARDDMLATFALGTTHYYLGHYPEALTLLRQALDSVAPGSLDAAFCHEYLGRVYGSMGEYAAALQHLEIALPIYMKAVNPKEAAQVRGLMGQIYQQQGQLGRARQNYRRALETFNNLSDRVNQGAVYYALGRLELRSGNYDAAENYLRQSIEVTENMRRVSTSRDLTTAFSATVHERYESYVECLMRKHQAEPARGLDVRAFETSELGRARSLAELLRATQTNLVPGLDPQLAAREKSLRQSLRVKDNSKVALLGRTYRAEELDALEAELSRLEAEYKQVTETIRAQYPSYEQITQPTAWSLRRIQEEVIADDQTTLLEYSLGEDKSYVWVVTRETITSYELPAQAQINEAARKVHKLLAAVPGTDAADELTPAMQELSRLVLSPVVAELNKPRLIIVADGALHYIPFQVLPIRSADNEPLVARYEIINAPSASVLGELQQEAARRQPAAKVLAAFGNPVFESNYKLRKGTSGGEQVAALQAPEPGPLQHALRDIELNGDTFDPSVLKPLFYAKRELANLRDVAGGETFVATDFAASREQLLRTDLTQYAILHFATHGFLDPKRPEFSGLVLSTVNPDGRSQNGFVGLQDIYGLRAPVSLVVLSACQTALGKDVRGEGLLGLTRGFMYAGASSVLSSLWKVEDKATAELMKRFYDNMLHKGMTPAAALRAAQNSIRQEPNWQSPYYWAAFTLQGDYRQVIRTTPAVATSVYPKIIAGGVLFAMLTGVGWWYRRHRSRRSARRAESYSTVKK